MELVVEPHVVRQESGYQSVSWLDTAAAIGMSRLTSKGVNVRRWSIFLSTISWKGTRLRKTLTSSVSSTISFTFHRFRCLLPSYVSSLIKSGAEGKSCDGALLQDVTIKGVTVRVNGTRNTLFLIGVMR